MSVLWECLIFSGINSLIKIIFSKPACYHLILLICSATEIVLSLDWFGAIRSTWVGYQNLVAKISNNIYNNFFKRHNYWRISTLSMGLFEREHIPTLGDLNNCVKSYLLKHLSFSPDDRGFLWTLFFLYFHTALLTRLFVRSGLLFSAIFQYRKAFTRFVRFCKQTF